MAMTWLPSGTEALKDDKRAKHDSMKNRRIRCVQWVIWLLLLAAGPGRANTLAIGVLHTFCNQTVNCADGASPSGGLIQLADGNFYGATAYGGQIGHRLVAPDGAGTIYEITPSGVLTTLYTFCSTSPTCTDGLAPSGTLTLGNDGFLYGVTNQGGLNNAGSIFKVSVSGQLMTLYSFCTEGGDQCTDGAAPFAGLIQGTDGNFYGTTTAGGANVHGGTIFKITPAGKLTTLYSFCAITSGNACLDGATPETALLQGKDGNLYGTTQAAGATSAGNVFRLEMNGRLTVLHSFCTQSDCADGRDPRASLIRDAQGNLYGTTLAGGSLLGPGSFGNGTIFKIAPEGTFTTLYTFCAEGGTCPDGAGPTQLMRGPNGNFYGLTGFNGFYTGGTVFELSAYNVLTTLTSFCETNSTNCPTGSIPLGFIRAVDGTFYGTTAGGGSGSSGLVFHLLPDEIFMSGFESGSSSSVP